MSSPNDDDSEPERTCIVIDAGSYTTKVGFNGHETPKAEFPTTIGRLKRDVNEATRAKHHDYYIGDEALWKHLILDTTRTVECGVVVDWDAMEKTWLHCFRTQLTTEPASEGLNVLLTDDVRDERQRQKMTEIMFESFNVPGLLVCSQALLSLYSYGRTSGVVLDSGYERTSVTPVHEGCVVERAVKRLGFGGKHVDEYLWKLLEQNNNSNENSNNNENNNNNNKEHLEMLGKQSGNDVLVQMKETICRVSETPWGKDYAKNPCWSTQYELPDGNVITMNGEHICALESLFNPQLFDDIAHRDTPGIHRAINDCVDKCFPDPHPRHFLPNIVLCGGNTMFEGLKERLHTEMHGVIPPHMMAKVHASGEHKHAAWLGGSILGSLSSTKDLWITKAEYDELGGGVVQKCGHM